MKTIRVEVELLDTKYGVLRINAVDITTGEIRQLCFDGEKIYKRLFSGRAVDFAKETEIEVDPKIGFMR